MYPTHKKRWTNHSGVQQLIYQSSLGFFVSGYRKDFRFQVNTILLFSTTHLNWPVTPEKCIAHLPLIIAAYSEITIVLLWIDGGVFVCLHLFYMILNSASMSR